MNKLCKILFVMGIISSTIYGGGNIQNIDPDNTEESVDDSSSSKGGLFSSYGIGGSKITLGDTFHKAIVLSTKTGYTFGNDISIYMLGESNYYRHMGDINDMGISGFGVGYTIPYTDNRLSVSAVAGLGMNINYNQVFRKFRESFDFGFAYRADISYSISKNVKANISYSKFDFNTNATKLEDTKPEIVGINFSYSFNAQSLLD